MKPERSLIHSIRRSTHTSDLVDKLGEVALDSVLKEGLARDIPIIGTAIALLRAGNNVAVYFFAKKIMSFLAAVESIPQEEREAFIEKESRSEEGIDHIGEVTLMILEKLDHPTLAKLLGRAFALLARGKTNRQTFEIHAYVIKNLNSYLIRQIEQFYRHEAIMAIDAPAAIQLSNYGLVRLPVLPTISQDAKHMNVGYERTEFGRFFYKEIVSTAV